MGSVVCSQCGYVRWDAAARCPACGAEPSALARPSTGLVQARPKRQRRPFFDTSWRESRPRAPEEPAGAGRHQRLAVGIAAAAVVAVLLIYFILAQPGGPEVLIQQGTTIGVPQGESWEIGKAGKLQGSFSVTNGSAEVCFADYDMFDYSVSHGISLNQCPSNATYSSGFVTSGQLSGSFGPGPIYLQTFISPDWNANQSKPFVTCTSVVEILPS